jgi:hypothetical protein
MFGHSSYLKYINIQNYKSYFKKLNEIYEKKINRTNFKRSSKNNIDNNLNLDGGVADLNRRKILVAKTHKY